MVAYIDLIILLNWCFDCLLLYWTSILLKRKIAFRRIVLGGAIGSVLILFFFSPFYNLANSVLIKIFFSLFMIFATFGFYRLKTFLKASAMFYFITFLTGGILLGVHFLFSFKFLAADTNLFFATKSYGDPVSWLFVVGGFPTAWMYSKRIFGEMEMTNLLHDGIVNVEIKIKDCFLSCAGLIDTGNQLYEPITNTPVMILSVAQCQERIPKDVLELLQENISSTNISKSIHSSWGERMHIIPYKVLGVEQQLLIAFRPDWIQLSLGDKRGRVHKGLVALTLQTVSHDGAYNCIVHPHMASSLQARDVS
ncbi:sigma-E processing peptidase SpoIIGA [Bacillus massiliigorillae]|uniref:sigma-E processing peptidase SpoIIGA n=1 Tax=Bacillus massiliigorillae TaxID=1243664 RepID=UPI00039BFCB5|nr:sigma-E processing peptidase SpoIIGA [Bacillus massiliigorillae]